MSRTRFAPTTSGPAHPGTLVAGLLAWLDARSRGGHVTLRLEDVDPARCTTASADDMCAALRWFGLDWDAQELQSANRPAHDAALDRLAELGLLYPCTCSRGEVSRGGTRAVDGGWRYTGRCRKRPLPAKGWRAADAALRLRLPDGRIELADESGLDLSQDLLGEMGDPVLRRRDGALAYHLAAVVDDGSAGVTRIVRGRDLATSTATHVALQRALGLPTPGYRHHFLFLEESGGKLAKLHGAVGWAELARVYSAEALCGRIAQLAGLAPDARETTPRALLARFDWARVRADDVTLRWDGCDLREEKR
ncbi:MAG TPA: glutamate--tRNA ligase family protein [Myxococcota bacterium]|nr:glutamate--tRNA ligase family protein [Myxococcota bacterium]